MNFRLKKLISIILLIFILGCDDPIEEEPKSNEEEVILPHCLYKFKLSVVW